ncbi:MAG: hypothetical protein RIS84_519 [Pseudomonadota bacterium]|jgi:signal transduction histidine kinase
MDKSEHDISQVYERLRELEKENVQLQISLEAVTEHADLIEAQLLEIQENLELKVQERTAELAEKNAELYQAKEAAEQARITAEMANRAKTAFLTNMSHELRTPLNAVIGYGEILIEDMNEKSFPHWARDMEKILAAALHLLSLINDVLDISKVESGKISVYLENFDIEALIKEITLVVQPLIQQKHNTLQVKLAEKLGEIYTDSTKVRQILFNLLSNAAKFTEHGVICLSAREEQTPDGHLWIVLSVSDEGIGMTPEQVKRLFQPFMQADTSTTRKFGGTGLGLAISKSFSEMLGGHITISSELNKGSIFTVFLPRVAPKK